MQGPPLGYALASRANDLSLDVLCGHVRHSFRLFAQSLASTENTAPAMLGAGASAGAGAIGGASPRAIASIAACWLSSDVVASMRSASVSSGAAPLMTACENASLDGKPAITTLAHARRRLGVKPIVSLPAVQSLRVRAAKSLMIRHAGKARRVRR